MCWGEHPGGHQTFVAANVLNNAAIRGKFEEAQILAQAGVPTVTVSRIRPQQVAVVDRLGELWAELQEELGDFIEVSADRGIVFAEACAEARNKLAMFHNFLGQPLAAITPEVWLSRANDHVGGDDLLNQPATPDYFAKKETIVREFRVHSFKGRSIRAGVKMLREGWTTADYIANVGENRGDGQVAHPWIRAHEAGWRIAYDGVTSRQQHRDLAHRAVTALGLDFGAVDIGEKADGSLLVLEVNRAPGIEHGTVDAYATALRAWMEAD